jgi:hypothetical protein
MTIQPIYDAAGTFLGFSAWLGQEWSAAQPYKLLVLAMEDSGSDVISEPPRGGRHIERWGGFGLVD